jgi:uncharacterized membrane protein YgdD (TMEM256/DUF423 family)
MNWVRIGAFLLALAVALGAFGAHALKGRLDEYATGIWEKAVFYHFIHGLGILLICALRPHEKWSRWALASGILLFSGSLYALALSGIRTWGAVTPLGGLAFIAGWLLLVIPKRDPAKAVGKLRLR